MIGMLVCLGIGTNDLNHYLMFDMVRKFLLDSFSVL